MSSSTGNPVGRFAWERALRDARLPSTTVLVLLGLGTFMNADGTGARPGEARLAAATGLRERAVRKHLRDAVDAGWIRLVARGHRLGNGSTMASEYRATVPVSTGTAVPIEDAGNGPAGDTKRSSERAETVHSTGVLVPEEVPQPARRASQPARDDTSTGTRVPPTNHDHVITTTPVSRDRIRVEAERLARIEAEAGRVRTSFEAVAAGIERRLRTEQLSPLSGTPQGTRQPRPTCPTCDSLALVELDDGSYRPCPDCSVAS